MEMHIGAKQLNKETNEVEWKASNTECIFFSQPASLSRSLVTNRKREGSNLVEQREEHLVLEEQLYNSGSETNSADLSCGRVTHYSMSNT